MRILVVEDERAIAEDIAATLARAGYVVDQVHDGEQAWFQAETEGYDAIILDLGLPQLDGITVLKRLRAAGPATPVLILTARASWSERVAGIDSGPSCAGRRGTPRRCWRWARCRSIRGGCWRIWAGGSWR